MTLMHKMQNKIDEKKLTNFDVKKRLKKIKISLKSKYNASNKKISYKCDICNFSHEAIAYDVWSRGCLNCRKIKQKENNRKIQIIKKGSLLDHPDLVKEYDKSNILKPNQIPNNSRELLKWVCNKCGHKWKVALRVRLNPSNKSQKYRNCIKCSYKIGGENIATTLLKKRGSLKDKNPDFLKEWDYKKNSITPEKISPYSSKKIWWVCIKKHTWLTTPAHRFAGTNCPECNNFKTSRAEIRVYSELIDIIEDVKWSYYFEKRQLDIYLPNQKLVFEIDGHYHKQKDKSDRKKNSFLKKRKIQIVRLRDKILKTKLSPKDFFVNTSEITIYDLKKIYKIILDTNLLNDVEKKKIKERASKKNFSNDKEFRRICSFLPGPPPEKSFELLNPKESLEWDYKKNFPLQPSMFTPGSQQKVSWLCSICGNSFYQRIYPRSKGQGCKKCGFDKGKIKRRDKLIIDKGSLKDKYPDLALEFLENKNQIKTNQVPIGSRMYAWWFCKKHKHQWQASVADRTIGQRHNCRYCYDDRRAETIKKSKFDPNKSLSVKFPKIFSKIKKDKNKHLDLKNIMFGSKTKIWFKCINGHIFQSTVNTQTSNHIDKLKCRKCYDENRSSKQNKKISKSLKGRKFSKETLIKMSKAQSGKNNPMYGKKLSKEHKRKISESGKGLKRSESTKAKMRKSFKGRIISKATRVKISQSKMGNIPWNKGLKII